MCWKFFIPNLDNVRDLDALRTLLPNHLYLSGVFKNVKGTFAFPERWGIPAIPSFAEKRESVEFDGAFFWGPLYPTDVKYEEFETETDLRIPVKLSSGVKISIVPATAMPRKMLLGKRRIKAEDRDEKYIHAKNFNRDNEYGKLAYELITLFNESEIDLEDPRLAELIELGLKKSYNLPLDVISDVIPLDQLDINLLFFCCMGADETALKKTC